MNAQLQVSFDKLCSLINCLRTLVFGQLLPSIRRSEMCIRDRYTTQPQFTDSTRYVNVVASALNDCAVVTQEGRVYGEIHYEYWIRDGENIWTNSCLLYTSCRARKPPKARRRP